MKKKNKSETFHQQVESHGGLNMDLQDIEKIIYENLEQIQVAESKEEFLEIGDPLLDRIIFGKGFPLHSIIQFTGNPHSYKSSFAANIAGIMREKYKSVVIYLDSENSTTVERLRNLRLNISKIHTGITVEKVSATLFSLIKLIEKNKDLEDVNFIVIWDSVAATPTSAQLMTEDVSKTISLKARILSDLIPKWITEILSQKKITLIAINQLRDKIQMNPYDTGGINLKNLGDKSMPGGNALMFLSSLIVENRVRTEFDESSVYGFRGKIVEIKTVKNKFFIDNLKLDLVFSPINGYVPLYSQFEFLKNHKRIESAGPVWKFTSDKNISFRARELHKKINESGEFRNMWYSELNSVIDKLIQNASSLSKVQSEETEENK